MDDLASARALCDELGEIFCLTFLQGVDDSDALLRMGGYPDSVQTRTVEELAELMASFDAGFPTMAEALRLGPWSVVIEPDGFHGASHSVLAVASQDTEAVSVLRHDYASAHFAYAIDGTIITSFEPGYPAISQMHGSDPQRLNEDMRLVGLRPPTDEDDNLPDLATHLRDVDDPGTYRWPHDARLLRALVAPGEDDVGPALRRYARMAGYDPAPAGIERVPAHDAIHQEVLELLPPEQPAESLIRLDPHIAQVARHIDDFFGFDQWLLFDTRWAAAHPDLARSLLRYAAHWDPYEA